MECRKCSTLYGFVLAKSRQFHDEVDDRQVQCVHSDVGAQLGTAGHGMHFARRTRLRSFPMSSASFAR